MPKFRVVSAHLVAGGHVLNVGDIVELDDYAGRVKIQQGFVVPASDDDVRASEGPAGGVRQPENVDPGHARRTRAGKEED